MVVKSSETVTLLGYSGTLFGATAIFSLVLLMFSGFTFLYMKKPDNRCIGVTYAIILFLSFIVFAVIAYAGPYVRGKDIPYLITNLKIKLSLRSMHNVLIRLVTCRRLTLYTWLLVQYYAQLHAFAMLVRTFLVYKIFCLDPSLWNN